MVGPAGSGWSLGPAPYRVAARETPGLVGGNGRNPRARASAAGGTAGRRSHPRAATRKGPFIPDSAAAATCRFYSGLTAATDGDTSLAGKQVRRFRGWSVPHGPPFPLGSPPVRGIPRGRSRDTAERLTTAAAVHDTCGVIHPATLPFATVVWMASPADRRFHLGSAGSNPLPGKEELVGDGGASAPPFPFLRDPVADARCPAPAQGSCVETRMAPCMWPVPHRWVARRASKYSI